MFYLSLFYHIEYYFYAYLSQRWIIKNPPNINLDIFLELNDGKNLNININIRIKKDIQIYALLCVKY